MPSREAISGHDMENDPSAEAKPDEIVTDLDKLEKCKRCGGELRDFLTSIVVERRLVTVRARCGKCGQKYVQFKQVPASLLKQFSKVIDKAEPWMQVMADETLVDKDNPLKKCGSCDGRLADHFTCTSGGHNWEVVRARCEKCDRRYVRFRRIYLYK